MVGAMKTSLTPRLVVRDADAALRYYRDALGGRELERHTDPSRDDAIVHATVELQGGVVFAVLDENREWGNVAPPTVDASTIVLSLEVDDPDAVAARMIERGAEEIFPVRDQPYGQRAGRVRDPFGHLWILTRLIQS